MAGFNKIKHLFHNTNSRVWFFVFVIFLFFLNYYTKTLFFRPCGPHQWRQADCLSITKNYYEQGFHFFEPKIHYQGPIEGRAVSEFPILNYTVACLWKLFGEHEFIYRLLEYLIFISGMYVLFVTLNTYFKSSWLSFFVVGFFLTSPLLAYYSTSFIADVPALSISIISYCLFYRFFQSKQLKQYYWSVFFAALAVLMKASALMPMVIIGFFTLADILHLNTRLGYEALFAKKTKPITALLVATLLVIAWYRFAIAYNDNNTNNIFLLTILPIWKMEGVEIISNLKLLFNNLFPIFHNKPMLTLFFMLTIYVVSNIRKLTPLLRFSFVFSGLFFTFYLVFFFQVFSVHDYYLSNLMFFPLVTLFCLLYLINTKGFVNQNTTFIKYGLIILMLFNSFHAAAIYRLRMIEDDKLVSWFPFISEEESKLAKYLFWDYGNHIGRVENFTPELRKHGIKREDFILTIPDQSFNISLYFMDQKGFCVSRNHLQEDTTVMDRFVSNRKIKYLVMSDTLLKREKAFQRHKDKLETFFTHNQVEVFKFK